MDNTSDEEEVEKSKKSKKCKEAKKSTSDDKEEFKEFTSVKGRKKKQVKDDDVNKEKEVGEVDLDKADEVSGKGSQRDVKGKTRVKNVETCGGYFEEPTTDDEKDDDLKFKERVVYSLGKTRKKSRISRLAHEEAKGVITT